MIKKIIVPGLMVIVAVLAWANWPIQKLPAGTKADSIVIEKSARKLSVVVGGSVVKTYEVSLGRNPVGPKEREGDKKTPEGSYRVIEHFRPSAFHRALRLSYPEPRDVERARAQGVPPGSDIMIHGIRNGFGFIGKIHLFRDWTAGCIAVRNSEIEELWDAVSDVTPVEIKE
jgi:murein L,D-transpeptidase YafK